MPVGKVNDRDLTVQHDLVKEKKCGKMADGRKVTALTKDDIKMRGHFLAMLGTIIAITGATLCVCPPLVPLGLAGVVIGSALVALGIFTMVRPEAWMDEKYMSRPKVDTKGYCPLT